MCSKVEQTMRLADANELPKAGLQKQLRGVAGFLPLRSLAALWQSSRRVQGVFREAHASGWFLGTCLGLAVWPWRLERHLQAAWLWQLRAFARASVIHPDDLQPVEKLPNGISRAGLLEAYRQVNLRAAVRRASMGSDLALALAQSSLQPAMAAWARALPRVATWTRCTVESAEQSLSCHNFRPREGLGVLPLHEWSDFGFGSWIRYETSLHLELQERGSFTLHFTANEDSCADSDTGHGGNCEVKCTCDWGHQSVTLFCVRQDVDGYLYGRGPRLDVQAAPLARISEALLGIVDHPASLLLLWRLLCAPTATWPRWEGPWKDHHCALLGGLLRQPGHHKTAAQGVYLELRTVFETVAQHLAGTGVPGADESRYPFDSPALLDDLALFAAGPPHLRQLQAQQQEADQAIGELAAGGPLAREDWQGQSTERHDMEVD
ncbi:unnamed protein product [Effrenium voratum]|uniref:Uncharacterized protein n=1 Tax=Effrenium voratum TaxID=2562239 RepID=A0AA36IN32_9DINO|nr:unnamed protein product [Effrenium voratum]